MSKGFTLLELIIVIGILAILGTVSVLVLNPAQLFAQARDTTRIQDLQTMNSALGLYVSSVSSPSLGATANCFVQPTEALALANCGTRHSGTSSTNNGVSAGLRSTASAGWIPVNFDGISGGSPLATLPVDPTNNATYFYSYAPDNTNKTYELNANLESTRYTSGTDNKEINTADGGNTDTIYEIGTAPGLDL